VPHLRRGLVPAAPSGLVEAPHQVDVLAETQRLVESADGIEGLRSHHDHRRRHVAHPRPRADACRLAAQVEWRARFSGHPRRHQAHPGIVEVGEQRNEPVVGRRQLHVGVHERHERARHEWSGGVAGGGRSAVHGQPHGGAVQRRLAPVVDRQAAVDVASPTELGRHHRDVVGRERGRAARRRMDRSGVEQPSHQP